MRKVCSTSTAQHSAAQLHTAQVPPPSLFLQSFFVFEQSNTAVTDAPRARPRRTLLSTSCTCMRAQFRLSRGVSTDGDSETRRRPNRQARFAPCTLSAQKADSGRYEFRDCGLFAHGNVVACRRREHEVPTQFSSARGAAAAHSATRRQDLTSEVSPYRRSLGRRARRNRRSLLAPD